MYFLVGNSHMENGNFEDAIQSFNYAQARMRRHTSRSLAVVSLVCHPTAALFFTVTVRHL